VSFESADPRNLRSFARRYRPELSSHTNEISANEHDSEVHGISVQHGADLGGRWRVPRAMPIATRRGERLKIRQDL